ncbi:hypothetical protein DY000_02004961 [Brassica cretica]|uniref:Uncharacterized protein n=1 Tax=Brassica cretica TaxID=69181 RepID=A0ABQ7CG80_BRACR|nr:hypothetical protein DY000_02004961 [Brassica cretica]
MTKVRTFNQIALIVPLHNNLHQTRIDETDESLSWRWRGAPTAGEARISPRSLTTAERFQDPLFMQEVMIIGKRKIDQC